MAALEQSTIRYDLKNIRNDIEDVVKNPTKDSIEKDNYFQYKHCETVNGTLIFLYKN